jgi:hypothetical protein
MENFVVTKTMLIISLAILMFLFGIWCNRRMREATKEIEKGIMKELPEAEIQETRNIRRGWQIMTIVCYAPLTLMIVYRIATLCSWLWGTIPN